MNELLTEHDSFAQHCILDSLLNQPVNAKPADMMKTTYESMPTTGSTPQQWQQRDLQYEHMPPTLRTILLEHCYARPFNWRPENSFLRPTKTLFINQNKKKKKLSEEDIDIENIPAEIPLIYDQYKAKRLMDECELHVCGIRDTAEWDEWEDKVQKICWSRIQHNMFESTVEILNTDRMARLANAGHPQEATLRRSVIDKSVKRFRHLLSRYAWDDKLVQWLHAVLMEYASAPYLAAYIDMLQTMKQKMTTFVDKLMNSSNCYGRSGALGIDALSQMMKRTWDPVASSLSQDKAKKLPGNPVLIIIPSCTTMATNHHSKRFTRWVSSFANIATVVTVQNVGCTKNMTMTGCLDQMFAATRGKIQEVKTDFPNRPIVLIGFNSGSALALQVAQSEPVLCTVCLGFSINTAEGLRGDPEDNLLELQLPVLFVIGQLSNTTLQENMEDIRERMRIETGLLVVGGADDYLRVNKKKQRSEGITQSIVDRCIVDEVADFVSGLLLSPYPPQIRQSPAYVPPDLNIKRPKLERKRNNSNGSSLDSEPPSPTPRITRPVGRPPGKKNKLDLKWQAMQQGIPNSIPNSIPSSPSNSNSITPPNPSTPESFGDSADFPIAKPHDKTQTDTTNAKLQALGVFPNVSITKSGVRTLPPNPSKQQIKILDSVTIPVAPGGKITRPQVPPQCASTYGPNMVLMPDGRYKSVPAPLRGSLPHPSARASLNKYINNRKLQSPRTKSLKKMHLMNQSLPPPTNLTSQDIMDLPIIFADDNQILPSRSDSIQHGDTGPMVGPPTHTYQPHASHLKTTTGKLMFVNKPFAVGQVKQNVIRQPSPSKQQKFTKIVLSKPTDDMRRSLGKLQNDKPVVPMDIDLEGELVATTIKKVVKKADPGQTSTSPSFKPVGVSYKTEAMSSAIITNKIKQAIKDMEEEEDIEVVIQTHKGS